MVKNLEKWRHKEIKFTWEKLPLSSIKMELFDWPSKWKHKKMSMMQISL